MKKNTIHTYMCEKEKIIPPRREILRYMACKEEKQNEEKLIDEFLPMVMHASSPRGSFGFFDIEIKENTCFIGGVKIESVNLCKNLAGCKEAVVFALSLGTDIDRLIQKYSISRPSAAFCINAAATAVIEEFADMFCSEMKDIFLKDKLFCRPRFSPGYGDFGLSCQPFFLNLVNASKLCGINLTDSLMMIPSKSVTAVMGVSEIKLNCNKSGCEMCENKNCQFKR